MRGYTLVAFYYFGASEVWWINRGRSLVGGALLEGGGTTEESQLPICTEEIFCIREILQKISIVNSIFFIAGPTLIDPYWDSSMYLIKYS